MEKSKRYVNCKFKQSVIVESLDLFRSFCDEIGEELTYHNPEIQNGVEVWKFSDTFEWLNLYNEDISGAHLSIYSSKSSLSFSLFATFGFGAYSKISLKSPDRNQIHRFFNIFEMAQADSIIPQPDEDKNVSDEINIFIGHGGNNDWRELKDHLSDKHGYKVSCYETGARAGHVIRDILTDLVEDSTFAILVMTAEDVQGDGSVRARQNVIHEAGLFQGALGFSKAIVLLEEGVDTFSNIDGIQYIPFKKGGISSTYGDILATIKREFEI